MHSLRLIGALDASPAKALTPLGQHLTRMPCDPRIGKMLLYGALLVSRAGGAHRSEGAQGTLQ